MTISEESTATVKDYSTPMKAIRAKCLNCSEDSVTEVRLCPVKWCPLYPYRSGKNPSIKRKPLTDEQKTAFKERLTKARKKKEKQEE